MSEPFKRCTACGEEMTFEGWLDLPFYGDVGDEEGWILEMRHHSCGTTLGMFKQEVSPERFLAYRYHVPRTLGPIPLPED